MTKKILLILVVSLVVGGGILFFTTAKTANAERIFTSEEVSNLKEISLNGNFHVNITTSDSKDVKCNFSNTKRGFVIGSSEFDSKIDNNILYVNTINKKDIVCIGGSEILGVNIDIPKSYKNKLSVKTKLGKINILNSNSKNIECDTKDGNTKISLNNICGNITVNSHLGDIDLKLPKDEKFNLSSNSHLGKVTNNLASNVDPSLKEKSINLSSSDGDVTISGN